MALLQNKYAILLFLAATMIQAVVLSAHHDPSANGCFPYHGSSTTCNQLSCRPICKAHGYIDTHAGCGRPPPGKGSGLFCCCVDGVDNRKV
ncbi:hypothetical protein EJB05_09270 [Eragrostis curvula]|uniref:Knottin scorpion toxin-like domain-containing protein n=1 Tax=Eragrostis curvula TaxID=38414 RepID=A0A5J9W4H8_9POAL|nr:hypothetical protein EJB05_09270 [Eragrostis curvula]